MKKRFGNLLAIICAMIMCVACVPLSSCAVYLDLLQEDYSEWYSEDGICGFTAVLSDVCAFGYFRVNGKTVRACFETSFDASVFITFPYSEDLNIVTESSGGAAYDTSYGVCHGVLAGRRDGDVFHVSNMRVGYTSLGSFDLYRRKVDPSTVDARDYAACVWKADDGCLTINYGMCGIDEYVAMVETGAESQSVYFRWLEGRRFEIGDKKQYEEERTVLANGTYSNDTLELSLHFETDTAFGLEGKTIELTGKTV